MGKAFNYFGRQFGWKLLRKKIRAGYSYLINPVSSFRYFELPFALSVLPENLGRCLDVSSPRLFSFCRSVSSASCFSRSWIFFIKVTSKLEKAGARDTSGSGSPSLTITTRFWQLAHQRSPLVNLKIGEEQAGQACFVRVAPCFSRSAMILMFSLFSVKSNPL